MANLSQTIVSDIYVNHTSTTNSTERADISLSVINIIGLVILTENVLTLIILYRSEKLPFQVRILAMSLSISDCLFGLGASLPARVVEGVYRCVYPYILTTSFLASFMSATVINCERCISMYFPMRYHSLVTKRKLITVCVIQFLLAIGLAIMRFNVPVPASGFYCGTLVDISPSMMNRIIADAFLVGNVVAYILMIWHFKGRRRQSAVIPVSAANKALSRLTFVSSFLVLCYSPAFIMSEIQAYVPDAGFMKPAKAITALLALVNSNLNPVLFVWRFYEVRYQFLVLFCFCNKPKLAQLRENRRNYFATFDISTADGSVNTNVKDI